MGMCTMDSGRMEPKVGGASTKTGKSDTSMLVNGKKIGGGDLGGRKRSNGYTKATT